MKETETSFLNDMEGVGLENFTAETTATPYLTMVQPDSTAAAGGATLGVWRNSTTNEEYGNVVRVAVLGFRTVWNERDPNPPFMTVSRYEPKSIEVQVQQPKNGQGYPRMINPKTGNEIQELFVYAVQLPEHPEAGVLLFCPTVSSMRACKTWNSQLATQRLSNGRPAPIFAYTWNLACDLVDNPAKKGAKMTKLVKCQRDALIAEDFFKEEVQPRVATIQQTVLAINGPEAIEA